MNRYLLTRKYTGPVHVTRAHNGVEVAFPDGSSEFVSMDHSAYDRYFDAIGTLMGYVAVDDDQTFLMIAPYVSLHNHSEYSLLDGLSKAKDIAKTLKSDSAIYSPFFALTDHGIPSGLPTFDSTLKKAGLCPINGMEFYAEDYDGAEQRASGAKPGMNHHLILIVKNDEGFKNLSHLVTAAQDNFYYHANVTVEMLRKHHEGLICMSACLGGELPQYIMRGEHEKAEEFIRIYREIFGDDFYFEVQNHGIIDEIKVAEELFRLGEKHGIKVVATSDSHYPNADDSYTHEVLLAIGTKKTMTDDDRMRFDGTGYHILNADEFYDLYPKHPEVISNAFEIVEKCDYHFAQRKIEMPDFEIPDGYTIASYFDQVVRDCFEQRFARTPKFTSPEYVDRLEYELSIIHQMEFEGYFLIVQDFIRKARELGVAVGPGRGSAVGSLVAYCLRITNADPIPYGLLFERFLNPERVSMPDIDIDFADERRQEVIDYVNEKYGRDHVSRIVAFGTEAARAVVKDVGRVFNMSPSETQHLADFIPQEPKMTIDKALDLSTEFKDLYESDDEVKNVIDIAKRIEGCTRNISMHACGVVIAKNPVADNIPEILVEDDDGNRIYSTAFTKDEVEENGCIKFDFLGLRNMSILQNACNSVGIAIDDIPLFDPKVYAYIATGNTDGIFQIESDGMKALMKDMFYDIEDKTKDCKTQQELDALGLECFERLVAAISLYRPGPIDCIPDYIAGMKDPHNVHYDCDELKPILKTTYGVICYQEQVQQICRALAGYSYGRADLIRRGMAKKKQYIIDAEKEVFLNGNQKAFDSGKDNTYVPGCINNGIPPEAAQIIWAKMEKFAEYAFNKSHSVGYAVISAQTAWLKYYHPVAFWAATLNSVITKNDKLKKFLGCVGKSGIQMLPPSVNHSGRFFTAEDSQTIRIGLSAVRNMNKASEEILAEREYGQFVDFTDFVTRCKPGKKTIESLGYAGAFDEFGLTRKDAVSSVTVVKKYIDQCKRKEKNNQDQLSFDEFFDKYQTRYQIEIDHLGEFDSQKKLELEYHYIGMYASEHPLDSLIDVVDAIGPDPISSLVVDDDEDGQLVSKKAYNKKVKVVGVIKNLEYKYTANGGTLAIGTIEDKTSIIKFVVFDGQLNNRSFNKHLLLENAIVLMDGSRKVDDFGSQIIVNNISRLESVSDNLSVIECYTDMDHYKDIVSAARSCSAGNLVVVIRLEFEQDKIATLMIDKNSDRLYQRKDRAVKDVNNLRINIAQYSKLKELSKNIKLK